MLAPPSVSPGRPGCRRPIPAPGTSRRPATHRGQPSSRTVYFDPLLRCTIITADSGSTAPTTSSRIAAPGCRRVSISSPWNTPDMNPRDCSWRRGPVGPPTRRTPSKPERPPRRRLRSCPPSPPPASRPCVRCAGRVRRTVSPNWNGSKRSTACTSRRSSSVAAFCSSRVWCPTSRCRRPSPVTWRPSVRAGWVWLSCWRSRWDCGRVRVVGHWPSRTPMFVTCCWRPFVASECCCDRPCKRCDRSSSPPRPPVRWRVNWPGVDCPGPAWDGRGRVWCGVEPPGRRSWRWPSSPTDFACGVGWPADSEAS